jgi:hypothetical protein
MKEGYVQLPTSGAHGFTWASMQHDTASCRASSGVRIFCPHAFKKSQNHLNYWWWQWPWIPSWRNISSPHVHAVPHISPMQAAAVKDSRGGSRCNYLGAIIYYSQCGCIWFNWLLNHWWFKRSLFVTPKWKDSVNEIIMRYKWKNHYGTMFKASPSMIT